MQPSASHTHEHARLDRVDRLLRLQNSATQLELLLKKSRDLETSRKYNEVLPLDNTETVHPISQVH
ncbi:MAG TPA: hypothetical protein VFD13_03420 [Candidatus Kapabacteria bacterium]|nr:hypothetical protein [Candidatus Kapabacteria bacterium]